PLLCEPGALAPRLLREGGRLRQGGAGDTGRAVVVIAADVLPTRARCHAPGGSRHRPLLRGAGAGRHQGARPGVPGRARTCRVGPAGEIVRHPTARSDHQMKAGLPQRSDWDYRGLAAENYDLWFGEEPFWDQAFFHERLRRNGGVALEIACGTGRLLVPL